MTDGIFLGLVSFGNLGWTGTSTELAFASGYKLRVDLEDANTQFNGGFVTNFKPGIANGADVRANFTLTAVPEPATWGMMIMGFGLAGATLRRRRASALAA